MTLNTCAGRGALGPSRTPVPTAAEEFGYGGSGDVVLCSNVRCSACDLPVRWHDGLLIEGEADVLPAAYAAADPRSVAGVARGLSSHRLYLCESSEYQCGNAVSLALASRLPQLALPRTWACGGHPTRRLPFAVGGLEIPAEPDWTEIVEEAFRRHVDPAAPRAAVHALQDAHGSLAGTEHPARIDQLITSLLSSPDPVLRGQALHFVWSPMGFPATDLLPRLVVEDAEALRSQPDPLAHYADLYDIAVCALAFHVDRRRWPYAGAVQQAIRAHAATPGRLAGVGWLLASQDRAWFLEHVDALLEGSPEAAEKVARWRRAAGG